jgi:uncharacterized membrane protein YqaE (UPF0057 family)
MRAGVAAVLALVLPPASVAITRGFGAALAISLVMTAGAPVVFRYLFAGPGLGLYLLAVVHALLALRPQKRTAVA